MIIKGAKVYTEEGTFAEKEVCTEGEVFTETSGDGEKVVDGSGCYLIPGLTDIHFHGCMGKDFCDGTEESIQVMADYEASQGVTTIAPATMTFDEERLTRIAKAAKAIKMKKVRFFAESIWKARLSPWQKKGHRTENTSTNRMWQCLNGCRKPQEVCSNW